MKKTVKFKLKGGALPNGFEVELTYEFDYEGITIEELVKRVTSGSSDRVKLQTKLRKLSTSKLNEMAKATQKIRWDEINSANEMSPTDQLMALSREDFTEIMVRDFLMTSEVANQLYDRKYGVKSVKLAEPVESVKDEVKNEVENEDKENEK